MIEHIEYNDGYPFKIIDIYKEKNKNEIIPIHKHSALEIVLPFYTNGCEVLAIKKIIHSGELLIIPSYSSHGFRSLSNDMYKGYALLIDVNFLNSIVHRASSYDFQIKNKHDQEILTHYFMNLIICFENESSFHKIKMYQCFYDFLSYLFNHCAIYKERKPQTLIEEVLDYCEEHLMQDLTIDSISSHFFISKTSLYHLFKNETGMTLTKYIVLLRLEKAKDLLLHSKFSINDIIEMCGFQSHRTFYRQFTNHYHISPKKIRRL